MARSSGRPDLIAGIDVGFEQGRVTRAAAAVLVGGSTVRVRPGAPDDRISLRAGAAVVSRDPAVLEALAALACAPDLLLADGQGLAHPRRFGLACHLGWLLDTPTIGVAKSRLLGEFTMPPDRRGVWSPLLDRGDLVGAALRTRRG